jgi:hypothetical protein
MNGVPIRLDDFGLSPRAPDNHKEGASSESRRQISSQMSIELKAVISTPYSPATVTAADVRMERVTLSVTPVAIIRLPRFG